MLGTAWAFVRVAHYRSLGPNRTDLSLLGYLAAHYQYGHDHRHVPHGFLIQNTQNRDAKAVHLKLDEIIRAHKGARNELVDLEDLSDEALKKLEEQFRKLRKQAEQEQDRRDEPAELR